MDNFKRQSPTASGEQKYFFSSISAYHAKISHNKRFIMVKSHYKQAT